MQMQADRHAGAPGIREREIMQFSNTTQPRPARWQRATKERGDVVQENSGGPRTGCAGQRRLGGSWMLRGEAGTSRYNNGASTSSTANHGSNREAMVQ
jgi:hypothetical protein